MILAGPCGAADFVLPERRASRADPDHPGLSETLRGPMPATSNRPLHTQPWLHQRGHEVQAFGTVRQFPIGLVVISGLGVRFRRGVRIML
jgi:hypothetical protein